MPARELLAVPVYYDFASTLCYVAHRVLERMSAELEALGIQLVWAPVDLVRLSTWRRGDPIEGARRENALRVASELGVAVRMPARWLDSRRASAVALALARTPREPAWRERVFCAVYEEGRVLDAPGELERLGHELGLDVADLASERRQSELETRTHLAREAEVTGVPAFQLGSWPLGGIQDPASMRAIFERFAARHRSGELD